MKILATVDVHDAADRPDLIEKLTDPAYSAKIERAVILRVEAYDWNCPQHITPRYSMEEVWQMVGPLNERIKELEDEIKQLKAKNK